MNVHGRDSWYAGGTAIFVICFAFGGLIVWWCDCWFKGLLLADELADWLKGKSSSCRKAEESRYRYIFFSSFQDWRERTQNRGLSKIMGRYDSSPQAVPFFVLLVYQ